MKLVRRPAYLKRAFDILKKRPILAILGSRQCGKTTLAQEFLGKQFAFLDLERPSDAVKLSFDPELFLREAQGPLIIDEAQRMPEIFPILRAEVDDRRKNGQFVLLGSASFKLVREISESLAGRVGFLDLTPLGLFELNSRPSLFNHWIKGGFPNALLKGKNDELDFDWYEHYTPSVGGEGFAIHGY